jgi:hypothetical protein
VAVEQRFGSLQIIRGDTQETREMRRDRRRLARFANADAIADRAAALQLPEARSRAR